MQSIWFPQLRSRDNTPVPMKAKIKTNKQKKTEQANVICHLLLKVPKPETSEVHRVVTR